MQTPEKKHNKGYYKITKSWIRVIAFRVKGTILTFAEVQMSNLTFSSAKID